MPVGLSRPLDTSVGPALTGVPGRREATSTTAKVKTDRPDSDLLAQLLRAGLIPVVHRIAREARGLRDLLRLRVRSVAKPTSCLNSLEHIREKFHVQRRDQLDPWYQHQVDAYDTQVALLTQQIHDLERALHPLLIPNPDVQRLV